MRMQRVTRTITAAVALFVKRNYFTVVVSSFEIHHIPTTTTTRNKTQKQQQHKTSQRQLLSRSRLFCSINENNNNSRDKSKGSDTISNQSSSTATASTTTNDDNLIEKKTLTMGDGGSGVLNLFHFAVVESTQDEARRLLKERQKTTTKDDSSTSPEITPIIAVSATEQRRGRGTHGRTWLSSRGNLFTTIAIPTDQIPLHIPTLLPLKIGTIVADRTNRLLHSCRTTEGGVVTVKWPNDVLLDDGKMAGILIENGVDGDGRYWYLIGIGVNVAYAPKVDKEGPQRGRRSACLKDYCTGMKDDGSGWDDGRLAQRLAEDIAKDITTWLDQGETLLSTEQRRQLGRDVVAEWETWAEWGKEQVLRDKPGNEVVIPVGVKEDGQLRVIGSDGMERFLNADYLL